MNNYVEQVKVLNGKISEIQKERTKVETKKEMLLAKLNDELAKYEKEYGVSLKGANLDCICNMGNAEREKVVSAVKQEYTLKLKVVEAINSGDIKTANELLGIKEEENTNEQAEEHSDEESVSNVSAVSDTSGMPEDFGLNEGKNVKYKKPVVGSSVDEVTSDDSNDFGFGEALSSSKFDEDYEEVLNITKDSSTTNDIKVPSGSSFSVEEEEVDEGTKISVPDGFDFGISVEEDSTPTGSVKKTGHLNIGSTADATVKELDKSKDENTGMFDDVDLDDFGFGSMLQGSKFDI